MGFMFCDLHFVGGYKFVEFVLFYHALALMLFFFFFWMIFTLTNIVDPDEMPPNVTFHLGLHCLQKYSFRGFPNTKG